MAELVIVALPDEATALAVGEALVLLQKQRGIEMEDVVIATRNAKGGVQLRQSIRLATGGAIGGGVWGTLIGLLFLDPAAGAGTGTTSDRLGKIGIDAGFLQDVAQSLDNGGAAVGLLLRKITRDSVMERLEPFQGRVLHTSLSSETEAGLTELLATFPPVRKPQDQPGGGRA